MKKVLNNEYYNPSAKSMAVFKAFGLTGTAFTMDAHSIRYCFSNGFFPRR